MTNISADSLMKRVSEYSRSAEGKRRIKQCIDKYAAQGIGKTFAGSKVVTEADMETAASKLIGVLRSTARSYDLPASVIKHFDSLDASNPIKMPDGSYVIYVYFGDDLHRDSLCSDGYDGVRNIVALLNNGYHAKDYVYGWWDNHKPTGDNAYRSGGFEHQDAWIRSKKERKGLDFIGQAIRDFNGNYGADYNVTAVASSDYE